MRQLVDPEKKWVNSAKLLFAGCVQTKWLYKPVFAIKTCSIIICVSQFCLQLVFIALKWGECICVVSDVSPTLICCFTWATSGIWRLVLFKYLSMKTWYTSLFLIFFKRQPAWFNLHKVHVLLLQWQFEPPSCFWLTVQGCNLSISHVNLVSAGFLMHSCISATNYTTCHRYSVLRSAVSR